jgi:hypothetical protein
VGGVMTGRDLDMRVAPVKPVPAGREQDARIALLLGWEQCACGNMACDFWVTPDKSSYDAELPHFSTDLMAAWQIIEQCYSGSVGRLSNGAEYEAYLVIERDGKNADGYARASTAAAAIVAAWLKAREMTDAT